MTGNPNEENRAQFRTDQSYPQQHSTMNPPSPAPNILKLTRHRITLNAPRRSTVHQNSREQASQPASHTAHALASCPADTRALPIRASNETESTRIRSNTYKMSRSNPRSTVGSKNRQASKRPGLSCLTLPSSAAGSVGRGRLSQCNSFFWACSHICLSLNSSTRLSMSPSLHLHPQEYT
jgi:hypothetical protein